MAIIRQEFKAKGTVCEGCSAIIRRLAMKVEGVKDASFDYGAEKGYVVYDDGKAKIEDIFAKIDAKGYECSALGKPEKMPAQGLGNESGKHAGAEANVEGDARDYAEGARTRTERDAAAASEDSVDGADGNDEDAGAAANDDRQKGNGDDEGDDGSDHANDADDSADEDGDSGARTRKFTGIAMGLLGIAIAAYFLLPVMEGLPVPEFSSGMGYGLLFIAGLLTGFHCIGMCGSFVVGYTAKNAQLGIKSHKSHLAYGAGKTLSYTAIGALFGLAGSIIAFTPAMRGAAGLLAGIFLILYGLKMLNVHPIFRKMTISTPKFISRFVHKEEKEHSNPLLIGLLNGLMIACGPLQAMYIMAAGTGSMIEGAKLLFIFGAGTLPAMLGFGYFASFVSGRMTRRILKASGVVVIVLGMLMLNNGLALTGTGYDIGSIAGGGPAGNGASNGTGTQIKLSSGYQEIRMDVLSSGWSPDMFVLEKGVPVKWIINGKEITQCNKAIQVPKLGLSFNIKPGEQVIEFTPTEEGTIPFSCWMGMIQGRFVVKSGIDINNSTAIQKEAARLPSQANGSTCGAGGCGCGCGG